jgi:nucleoside-diphosphate-sugar epimerase
MIIGNGLIAKSLQNIDSDDVLFFASGVSNSLETKDSEFQREFTLLQNALLSHSHLRFFYFSTLSILDQSKQDSQYVQHKKAMEEYIAHHSKNYLILRIGNLIGKGGNPNTLFNFLKNKIIQNDSFEIHTEARRLILGIEDLSLFIGGLQSEKHNKILNFSYPYYYKPQEIVSALETEIGKESSYKEISDGDFYTVEFCEEAMDYFKEKEPNDYLKELVKKYL